MAIGTVLLVAGCQEPPSDQPRVTKTRTRDGKEVNMIQSTDKDKQEVLDEAREMKKSTDPVTFTPDEQKAGK